MNRRHAKRAEGSRWVAGGKWPVLVCPLLTAYCLLAPAVWAQNSDLTLHVRRNVGYSGGSQIRGSFRMEVAGPDDLVSVTFKIDDEEIGAVTAPPFKINFNTADYALGWHDLSAVGRTADGRTLASNVRRFEFVSSAEEWAAVQSIMIPMLGVLGVIFVLAFGVPILLTLIGKKASVPLGAPRKYGIIGGTICPKCGRPFALHWWGFNVSFAGKLDRCDHCGRWSFVRRMSQDKLREAEGAELKLAQPESPIPEASPEDKLKQQLDDSRFFDGC
jgi:hypothetical protein